MERGCTDPLRVRTAAVGGRHDAFVQPDRRRGIRTDECGERCDIHVRFIRAFGCAARRGRESDVPG